MDTLTERLSKAIGIILDLIALFMGEIIEFFSMIFKRKKKKKDKYTRR